MVCSRTGDVREYAGLSASMLHAEAHTFFQCCHTLAVFRDITHVINIAYKISHGFILLNLPYSIRSQDTLWLFKMGMYIRANRHLSSLVVQELCSNYDIYKY